MLAWLLAQFFVFFLGAEPTPVALQKLRFCHLNVKAGSYILQVVYILYCIRVLLKLPVPVCHELPERGLLWTCTLRLCRTMWQFPSDIVWLIDFGHSRLIIYHIRCAIHTLLPKQVQMTMSTVSCKTCDPWTLLFTLGHAGCLKYICNFSAFFHFARVCCCQVFTFIPLQPTSALMLKLTPLQPNQPLRCGG